MKIIEVFIVIVVILLFIVVLQQKKEEPIGEVFGEVTTEDVKATIQENQEVVSIFLDQKDACEQVEQYQKGGMTVWVKCFNGAQNGFQILVKGPGFLRSYGYGDFAYKTWEIIEPRSATSTW